MSGSVIRRARSRAFDRDSTHGFDNPGQFAKSSEDPDLRVLVVL